MGDDFRNCYHIQRFTSGYRTWVNLRRLHVPMVLGSHLVVSASLEKHKKHWIFLCFFIPRSAWYSCGTCSCVSLRSSEISTSFYVKVDLGS